MVKRVSILGATGSVGRCTEDVILANPGAYDVQAVTANRNADALAGQAVRLNAKMAVVADPSAYAALKTALSGTGISCCAGRQGMIDAASMPADWSMAAIIGMAGLEPLMVAIAQGTSVAIANKEPLVAAGPLVMVAARKAGTALIPVDSEHNAIFQVLEPRNKAAVRRLILTASGGPFREWTAESMARATPVQALAHPNWSMGKKISIDSATMMNKALEVIEAAHLFNMPSDKIDVLVHPQSVIHSMVEYVDGSILAHMGASDMRVPIAHAIAWPERSESPAERLNLLSLPPMTFAPVDGVRFPSVALAYECLKSGSAACIALNAANEVAVAAFLSGAIEFPQIVSIVRDVLDGTKESGNLLDLDSILAFDRDRRMAAESCMMTEPLHKPRLWS